MSRVRVLSDKDISQIINLKSVVVAVEDAYKQKSNNSSCWLGSAKAAFQESFSKG